MKVDLSVIIPVYNAARYVNQAVDSVLNQEGITKEIIIVNDGSTDETLSKLEGYSSSVIIETIDHAGASAARNYGLHKANGEFVMFLDADDFLIDNTICKECIERIKKEKLEMVLFSYQYLNDVTGKFVDVQTYDKFLEDITDGHLLLKQMIQSGIFPASPCFKVIKRELLVSNRLFFRIGTIAEDLEWFVRLVIATNRFGIINKPAYIYRKNVPDSVTFTMNEEKCRQFLNMILSSIDIIKERGDVEMQNALYSSMAYEYCILIGNVHNVEGGNVLEKDLKGLSWLLDYDLFPRIKYAKWLYRILGYRITSSLFGLYIRWFAKSNR